MVLICLQSKNGVPKDFVPSSDFGCLYRAPKEVVVRRYSLLIRKKAEARAHILEGLLIALDHIDEVIRIIRASETDAEAQAELMSKFKLSERQKSSHS